jgi:hypothetical protein
VPQELWAIATQIGVTGAFMLLAALWLLHKGVWVPADVVKRLLARIVQLEGELATERKQHREDVTQWERRTFNALGVSDRLTRTYEEERVARRSSKEPV